MTTRTPANKGRKYPAEPLTASEVEGLIRACSNRAPTGIRNRALLAVLWRCGLRLSEALALYPKDIDGQAGTLRVLHGKGDRARTVGVEPGALAIVARWQDVRRKLNIGPRARLFCTLAGHPLKTAYVRALLPRLARKAGIEKRVHAHGLRHTHASELAAEGIPMNVVQAVLGHSNLSTTSRYLAHVAPQQVVNGMRSRGWHL
jgi:site-specific recombinase XerD